MEGDVVSASNKEKHVHMISTKSSLEELKPQSDRFILMCFYVGLLFSLLRPIGSPSQDIYFRLLFINLFFYLLISGLLISMSISIKTLPILRLLFVLQTLILTFPYGFLSMTQHFYYESRGYYNIIPLSEKSILEEYFLKNSLPTGFPGKAIVFILFILAMVGGLIAFNKWREKELSLIWLIVLVTTWRSTSYGSPVSWSSSREFPVESHRVYLRSHWEDGAGAVSADQPVWSDLLRLFQFGQIDNTTKIRRPFTSYIVANLSFFNNSYSAWIFVNLILWVFASFSCIYILRYLKYSRLAQISCGLIIALAPIFKTFVGQSSGYLSSFAASWILMAFIIYLKNNLYSTRLFLVATYISFSLAFLTWDLYYWIPLYLLFFIKLKILDFFRGIILMLSGFLTLLIYRYILIPGVGIQVVSENENILFSTFRNAFSTLLSSDIKQLDEIFRQSVMNFFGVTYMLITPVILFLLILTIFFTRISFNLDSWSKFIFGAFFYVFSIMSFFSLAGTAEENSLPSRFSILLFPFIFLFAQLIDQIPKQLRFAFIVCLTCILLILFVIQISNIEEVNWIYHNINMGIYRPMVW